MAPPAVDDAAQNRAGFYSVDKDNMEQTWVVMGMLAGRRDDPDYCALEVMNQILGGGFSSRLFSNVRTNQGLAYAVGSSRGAQMDRPGLFTAEAVRNYLGGNFARLVAEGCRRMLAARQPYSL